MPFKDCGIGCRIYKNPQYHPFAAAMVVPVETLLVTVVTEGAKEKMNRIKISEAHRKASSE